MSGLLFAICLLVALVAALVGYRAPGEGGRLRWWHPVATLVVAALVAVGAAAATDVVNPAAGELALAGALYGTVPLTIYLYIGLRLSRRPGLLAGTLALTLFPLILYILLTLPLIDGLR